MMRPQTKPHTTTHPDTNVPGASSGVIDVDIIRLYLHNDMRSSRLEDKFRYK